MSDKLPVIRQRQWSIRMVAEGKCLRCGKKREGDYACVCNACAIKYRKQNRKAKGYRKKRPEGRGRFPIIPE